MPVVWFHLSEGCVTAEREKDLLVQASTLYADVLAAPIERVRVFIRAYPASCVAVAGVQISEHGPDAPLFEFFVLKGRPLSERQKLLAGFTDLLVRIMDVRRERVRGRCIQLDPEDWAIGGVLASELRRHEIDARMEARKDDDHAAA
ncbi:4-oxalocrotonate tautomerase [Pseudoxanthomonas kalamensis DSM 18571]|uniref:4-oxalocrotonate tautomerase n=1 Tax=Pseudoxanthomonas kalamensis TaxID=289483 RepID=UPI001390E5CF|nr:4-oxalocrotonate tautomerase [Pseudoxanthomonas kalamensis]KAF1711551.1 4-oxalocrotonate tautomerase [Pseudoxanthomonas kalamensis DSM 18571]